MQRSTSAISAPLLISAIGVLAIGLLAVTSPASAQTAARVVSTETFAPPPGFTTVVPVQGAGTTGLITVDLHATGGSQAALLDTRSGQYTLLAPGAPASHSIGITPDGHTVAYSVRDAYFTASHVFVRDLSTGATEQIDLGPTGAPVDAVCSGSGPSSLTPDGRLVAFTCGASRPYVRDRQSGQLAAAPDSVNAAFGYALLDDGRLLFSSPGTAAAPDFSNLTGGYVYSWTPATGAVAPVVDCGTPNCDFGGASGDGHLLAYVTTTATVDMAHVRNLTTNARWTSQLSRRGWAASVAHDGSAAAVHEGTDGVHPIAVFIGDPDHGFTALNAAKGEPAGQLPTWLDDDARTIWSMSDRDAAAWHLALNHDPAGITVSVTATVNPGG
jgi:hypothetical protein